MLLEESDLSPQLSGARQVLSSALRRAGATVSGPLLLRTSRLEYLERAHERVVHSHHCAGVVELAAVVRRREDRDEFPASEELVAILDDLVGTHDQVEVVPAEELSNNVTTEGKGDSPVVLVPSLNSGERII